MQDVKWWELRWCQKTWVQDKMVLECKLFKKFPLHIQELNYKKIVYELKDCVEKETLNLNLSSKLGS
jgi:hypothetical protein